MHKAIPQSATSPKQLIWKANDRTARPIHSLVDQAVGAVNPEIKYTEVARRIEIISRCEIADLG